MGGGEHRRRGDGADGTVSGSAGCYRLMGRADVGGQTITFGPVATMACAGTVMDQERMLLDALTSTRSYRIAAAYLLFTTGRASSWSGSRDARETLVPSPHQTTTQDSFGR
jgi:heat shock protein HslJ